ncbi:hypothetical protein PM082_003687 [Marasmius tenuissimus]|nr:hypothetical protein PM082_003687 [Marasmius tenuissimus]
MDNDLKVLILIVVCLFTSALAWCFISSCLGISFRRMASSWWDYSTLGAANNQRGYGRRGGTFGDDNEFWEMEMRGRRGAI